MHATQELLFFPHPKVHYIFQWSDTQFYKIVALIYCSIDTNSMFGRYLVLFSTHLFQSILFINFE